MGLLEFIFGAKKREVENYIKNDAVILDVRTQREWDSGHIENALHIPINDLKTNVEKIKALNKPIIACCASGVRSAKAAKFLRMNNIDAVNGGGWISVKSKINT